MERPEIPDRDEAPATATAEPRLAEDGTDDAEPDEATLLRKAGEYRMRLGQRMRRFAPTRPGGPPR